VTAGTALALACASAGNSASALGTDNGGRFTTQVTINGQGPFAFIVDTGAERTVISQRLAARLQLWSVGGARVVGASGTEPAKLYMLRSFHGAVFSRNFEPVVAIPNAVSEADGILGMNVFASNRIEMDFADSVLAVRSSEPAPKDFLAVPVVVTHSNLVIADVTVNGIPAKALIDTGARRTVANTVLQRALGFAPGDPRLSAAEPIGGATDYQTPAVKAQIDRIVIGGAQFSQPILTFADLPMFASQGIGQVPALHLGLDLLMKLRAIAIDYPQSELQIKL